MSQNITNTNASNSMFCFQCEQTAGCTGCTRAGVCGKSAMTAKLQDTLTGALIALANIAACSNKNSNNNLSESLANEINHLILEGLFATITNVNFDDASIKNLTARIHAAATKTANACNVSIVSDYDMNNIWNANEDIRSLKSLILFGVRGMAAYAYHAMTLGYTDASLNQFFLTALDSLSKDWGMNELLPIVMEVGRFNLTCMELLDRANTETFGDPVPVSVSLTVEKGPFIVVTGHDLEDIKQLLEQTKDKGINIYTHGEMLPAHAYPELKKYPHLKGNFGTAWQNQQKEFASLPAPILFTTNCLMPPKASYADRVFTTGAVVFPNTPFISSSTDGHKDFTPVIEKALELGGFSKDQHFTGINGGSSVMTGFARNAILSSAGEIVDAVKSGAIKKFVVMAGCDGRAKSRNYYTDFAKELPKDAVILTAGCAKYKYNKLDLGDINGIPRVLDAGQCNDSYSLAVIALKLKEVFGLSDINELPIVYNISWYEQKAVIVLLSLLYLGVKNIHLGPTLPAFLSPNVAKVLVENFGIAGIGTVEDDLKLFFA